MSKIGLSSGMSTTFELGSSDLHRLPAKPFAPAQSLKPLSGSWAREKNARSAAAYGPEYHPARLQPDHKGISPWDHASPKLRSTLSNATVYDELVCAIEAQPQLSFLPLPLPAAILQTVLCRTGVLSTTFVVEWNGRC
eukprot:SAG31_NODE_820_length_11808_cov_16.331540_2_plen_138_part_00